MLEGFDLPFFEAAPGRAPLLQFWGSDSPTAPLSDVEQIQSEYGGPHHLVVYEGAAHHPVLEPVRYQFWDRVEAFLNDGSHHESFLCDSFTGEPCSAPLDRGAQSGASQRLA